MVLVGHMAEHVHQEEENHAQEARLAALEARAGLSNGAHDKKNH
eukprot:CAMPEP_0169128926 /NCGR_PEP_ID=MMETSP1015-20121227/36843_1 /TAXON_ID=342587 /ORGANISM="Karlodinium micrum, Strain CCMP2283" /LENGTH=43 /DNA_ID= /DNA_START= /DNA_END= /DNA_ORIENTATION=